ncbi:unnamed protein product [Pocillopora meandrina]|uniref:Uncharacterized protein n=1 Tax=Pocillopora meandrina TaxID=46732 RepID=A0AAU9XAC7_9CNID|nr:unnamed protein product [Pocillopora meandrina]
MAEENGICHVNGEPEVVDDDLQNGEPDEDDKEYEALDLELDQINSCLDKLENWNDSLRSRMKDMLETMQKTRIEREIQTNQDDGHNGTQP